MTEQQWINAKTKLLIEKEGYKPAQAYAIANSMVKKEYKAQEGAWYQTNPSPMNSYQGAQPNYNTSDEEIYNQYQMYGNPQGIAINPENNAPLGNQYLSQEQRNTNMGINTPPTMENPFSGAGSMESGLYLFGQGLGEKDPWKTAAGASTSILKAGRTGLAGYASGKENKRVYDEYYKTLYEDTRRPKMLQEGGGINNADIMTGQYLIDNPNGNVEIEDNEHVKDNITGEIKKAVGDNHENGGVNVQLENAKILSDYTKIGAKNAKELKEKYNLSVKPTDTFAKVMDKGNKKIGVEEAIKEQAEYIAKLGKNESVKDEATKRLNETVLTKEIKEYGDKLAELKPKQNLMFEDIFARQEMIPKKGNGNEILDSKGKVIEAKEQDVAQEGMAYNAPMTPEEERRSLSAQMPVERMLYNVGTSVEKQGLPPGSYTRVDYAGGKQDYLDAQGLEDFKRKANYRVFMESQQPAKTSAMASMKEGGDFYEMAKKYGISTERAQELIMQEGGEMQTPQEDPMQQVMQMIAQSLQQGMPPEQIAEQLSQMGVPQEQIPQMIQAVMAQMQGQTPQEEQPMMKEGGKIYAQEGKGYNFSTRYKPTLSEYETDGTSIVNQDRLTGVEEFQPFTGKGYGAKMEDVEKTINAHSWYFDTDAKKKAFREAVVKKGAQPEVKAFQEAYNKEIEKRASTVGIPKNEIENIKKEVGFSTEGVQKVDGLYGAFTSTRPLYTFSKKDGEVLITPEAQLEDKTAPQADATRTKATGSEYYPFILPPSAMQPIAKPYVPLGRIEPVKQTIEPYLAEQAKQLATSQEQLAATGLAPQMQQALGAQQLAAGQIAANDAIGKVEQYSADNQFKTDQFNIGQGDKENLMSAQLNMDYQDKMTRTVANQEAEQRSYFNNWNEYEQKKQQDNFNRAVINAQYENKQINPDGSISFIPSQSEDIGTQYFTQEQLDKMTPQERIEATKAKTDLINAQNKLKGYKQYSAKLA